LEKHYILVHEEGFPVRIKPGILWDSRTEMNNGDFHQRIDQILGEIGSLTSKSASTNEPFRLLFFVHGGLNTYHI